MDSAWACRSQPSVVWGVKDGCFRRQLLQSEGAFARSRTQPGEVSFAQFKPSGWTVLNPLSLWLKSVRWPAGSDGLSAAWNDARQSVECWDFFGATGLGAVEDSLRHNHRSFNNEQCCRKSPEVVSGESWPWGRGRLYCCVQDPLQSLWVSVSSSVKWEQWHLLSWFLDRWEMYTNCKAPLKSSGSWWLSCSFCVA